MQREHSLGPFAVSGITGHFWVSLCSGPCPAGPGGTPFPGLELCKQGECAPLANVPHSATWAPDISKNLGLLFLLLFI